MFGEVPEHIRKRHEKDVPSLGALDGIVLAPAPVHYEQVVVTKEAREAVLDSSAKLDDLTQKALDFYDELLSEPMSTDDMKMLSAQADAARTILTTQLRVDDSRLKKRNSDVLGQLLERMSVEDARLVKVING